VTLGCVHRQTEIYDTDTAREKSFCRRSESHGVLFQAEMGLLLCGMIIISVSYILISSECNY